MSISFIFGALFGKSAAGAVAKGLAGKGAAKVATARGANLAGGAVAKGLAGKGAGGVATHPGAHGAAHHAGLGRKLAGTIIDEAKDQLAEKARDKAVEKGRAWWRRRSEKRG